MNAHPARERITDRVNPMAAALTGVRAVAVANYGGGDNHGEYFGTEEFLFTTPEAAREFAERTVADNDKYPGDYTVHVTISEALCWCGELATIVGDPDPNSRDTGRYPYCAECWGARVAEYSQAAQADDTVHVPARPTAENDYAVTAPCEHPATARRMAEWTYSERTGESYRAVWCHACGDEIEIEIDTRLCGVEYPYILDGHAITCNLPPNHTGAHTDELVFHPAIVQWARD